MSLPYKVEWWLLHDGKSVAAEVLPSQPSRRAWIKIRAAREKKEQQSLYPNDVKFGVRYFEIEKSVLEDAKIKNRYIENNELLSQEVILVKNEEELASVLSRWLSDLDKLVLPYFCDCPV